MTRPLWLSYFDLINEDPLTSSPSGQDAPRVKQLLAELYRLGERPTREEVAAHLRSHNWDYPLGIHQKTVLRLWTERLRHPHRRWKGRTGWIYPFYWAERFIAESGGDSIATRLARVVSEAAADYAAAIERDPASDEAEAAAEELRHAAYALSTWGLVLDRSGDEYPGGCLPSPIPASQRRNPFTTRGRRRYDEWLAHIRAEWAKEQERREADGPTAD
jgi:hypothetical protein